MDFFAILRVLRLTLPIYPSGLARSFTGNVKTGFYDVVTGSFVKLPIDEPIDGMAHDRGASIGLFEVTGDCGHIINKAGLGTPSANIFSGPDTGTVR